MDGITIYGSRYRSQRALLTVKGDDYFFRFDLDVSSPPPPLLTILLRSPGRKWIQGTETMNLLARLSLPCNACQPVEAKSRKRTKEQEHRLTLFRQLSEEND